jgi:hypothetical protein
MRFLEIVNINPDGWSHNPYFRKNRGNVVVNQEISQGIEIKKINYYYDNVKAARS